MFEWVDAACGATLRAEPKVSQQSSGPVAVLQHEGWETTALGISRAVTSEPLLANALVPPS